MSKYPGLTSYIVIFTERDEDDGEPLEQAAQFWAEDETHAGEQAEDAFPDLDCILLIETQESYEARTGLKLAY